MVPSSRLRAGLTLGFVGDSNDGSLRREDATGSGGRHNISSRVLESGIHSLEVRAMDEGEEDSGLTPNQKE